MVALLRCPRCAASVVVPGEAPAPACPRCGGRMRVEAIARVPLQQAALTRSA